MEEGGGGGNIIFMTFSHSFQSVWNRTPQASILRLIRGPNVTGSIKYEVQQEILLVFSHYLNTSACQLPLQKANSISSVPERNMKACRPYVISGLNLLVIPYTSRPSRKLQVWTINLNLVLVHTHYHCGGETPELIPYLQEGNKMALGEYAESNPQ